MDTQLPESIELATDLSPASWIVERLWHWPDPGTGGVWVGSVIAEGFEAYARVFHPAYRRVGERLEPVRWSTIAAERGKLVHPEMHIEAILGTGYPPDQRRWAGEFEFPHEGCLPKEECAALAEVLGGSTETPGRCWLCIWEGYGFWGQGTSLTLPRRHGAFERWRQRRRARARSRREARRLSGIPRVHGRGRDYFLFSGSLDAAASLEFGPSYQSPNLWWPDDRAWCVATEIDGCSTYVGGSAACIEALLGSPLLEALPSRVDARFDIGGDVLNSSPRGGRQIPPLR